jgi:hypothetical protein
MGSERPFVGRADPTYRRFRGDVPVIGLKATRRTLNTSKACSSRRPFAAVFVAVRLAERPYQVQPISTERCSGERSRYDGSPHGQATADDREGDAFATLVLLDSGFPELGVLRNLCQLWNVRHRQRLESGPVVLQDHRTQPVTEGERSLGHTRLRLRGNPIELPRTRAPRVTSGPALW